VLKGTSIPDTLERRIGGYPNELAKVDPMPFVRNWELGNNLLYGRPYQE
jgi:hypothetical protein